MANALCTLAQKYNPDKHDLTKGDWVMSEKLDGVRALWNPEQGEFLSRTGKVLHAPPAWLAAFRQVYIPLDGELFAGRGRFQDCVSLVRRKQVSDADWLGKGLKYVVFDSYLNPAESFTHRLGRANYMLSANIPDCLARIHPHIQCTSHSDAQTFYSRIRKAGGEGVMLRLRTAPYEFRRSPNLLKWKGCIDGLAVVTDVQEGEGKHAGRMGALVVHEIQAWSDVGFYTSDKQPYFKVGTGFTDAERERKDWVGKIIRWDAHERTRDSIPRHPSFRCIYEGD